MPKTPYWTRELVFEAFEKWEAEHGKLPTSLDWRKTTQSKGDAAFRDHPTSRYTSKMFGTWRQAILEYMEHRQEHKKLWRIWTPEEMIEAVQRWAEEEGVPPSHSDFSHSNGGRLPSMTAIKSRYEGGYRQLVEDAGFRIPPHGVTYRAMQRYQPLPRKGRA